MPNWCETDFKLTGPAETISQLTRDLSLNDFTEVDDFLNRVVPQPAELLADSTITSAEMPDWFQWRMRNWDVKWDAEPFTVNITSKSVSGSLSTPWGPPLKIFKTLATRYPEIKIKLKWFEAGMGFQGELILENGVVVFEEDKEYKGSRGG